MEKKWNWGVFWTAVSAVATSLAVGVAVWIGHTANEVAKQGREIAEKSFSSMERMNKTQRQIMSANTTKMLNDTLYTDKMHHCRNVMRVFGLFFYVMADKTDKELALISSIPFGDVVMFDHAFRQKYGIKNDDELAVIKSFLSEFYNEKSQEFGISCAQEACSCLYDGILVFEGLLYSLYDKEEEEDRKELFEKGMMHYFYDHEYIIDCMRHMPNSGCDEDRRRFHYHYENEEQNAKALLKKREEHRQLLKGTVSRYRREHNDQGAEYWQKHVKFMDRNDKGGKKDPCPPAEMKEEKASVAGKKGKPADTPAVKAETKQGR